MKRTLYAAALALACAFAMFHSAAAEAQTCTGGSITYTWTAPTARTDGSALTNLAGFNVYYGTTPGSYPTKVNVPGAAVLTTTVCGLTGGTTYYAVATAYDANNIESAQTNPVTTALPVAPPNPPGGFAVTAKTAYQLKASGSGPRLASIGEVPIGTACDQTVSVTVDGQTYYAVPSIDVAFSNSGSGTRSTIYAQCAPSG